MIIVPVENHFIALAYDESQPEVASVCLYEEHGHGIIELTPVLDGEEPLTVAVNFAGKDKVELLMELKRRLPLAESRFRILNTANNARLFRPEDAQKGEK